VPRFPRPQQGAVGRLHEAPPGDGGGVAGPQVGRVRVPVPVPLEQVELLVAARPQEQEPPQRTTSQKR
jgi:hypothetical protein